MRLVAGVDSSTQSVKVVVRDAETGAAVREGRAAHPDGTEVDPSAWWDALTTASAGLLDGVEAVAVAGQQHGMVVVDDDGQVVRPALLWNDTRSAARRGRPGRRARRSAAVGRRGRLGPGGQLHGDQAALAGPARAGGGRAGRPGDAAARLADVAARRGRSRPDHRPRGRVRHGLLVAGNRCVPARPAEAGVWVARSVSRGSPVRPKPWARPPPGRCWHLAPVTTWRPRWAWAP